MILEKFMLHSSDQIGIFIYSYIHMKGFWTVREGHLAKAIKSQIKLSVGDTWLTPLELWTTLMEIANQCNDRPLEGVLSREDGSFEAVRPNHLIARRSGMACWMTQISSIIFQWLLGTAFLVFMLLFHSGSGGALLLDAIWSHDRSGTKHHEIYLLAIWLWSLRQINWRENAN